jgi:ATP-dependent Lhr-like helicase
MKASAKVLSRIRRMNRMGPEKPRVDPLWHDRLRATWPCLSRGEALSKWKGWFEQQGWSPFMFQLEAWEAFGRNESGLIAVATGSGKTYAAMGGPLVDLIAQPPGAGFEQLSIVYISPLKALVRDIAQAIQRPLDDLRWPIEIGLRTGDTSAAIRRRLKERFPHVLVTTPESLAILLTDQGWQERMRGLRCIVLDEWHELIGSKRGSLLELTVARLRAVATEARVWALSATIANLDVAAAVAVGQRPATIIRADLPRSVQVESILPASMTRCPWFGYSGLRLLPDVIRGIDPSHSTLLFTNTRSHAERWYQGILQAKPDWTDIIALHHGSLDQEERQRVEEGIKSGRLRLVVATSSLDLGVDFPRVQDVIQIGSAKSIARAVQRAGRAFHRPGEQTRVRLSPTNVMEILEASAVREAIKDGVLEERAPLPKPMDVLVQFLLNSAFNEGFDPADMLRQVRSTYSFRAVTDDEFAWALSFIRSGGALSAYPEFHKVEQIHGRYRFASSNLARQHKVNIGTILSDSGVAVQIRGGATLGMIDETFAAKLRPGDVIQFGGRTVAFLQMRDMTAFVKPSKERRPVATVWNGTLFPLSVPLSRYLRHEIDGLRRAVEGAAVSSPEIRAFLPIARIQHARSRVPAADQTLLETARTREGHHLFVYTWEGSSVNEGLGHVAAYRLSRLRPNTISVSATNYGFELLSSEPLGSQGEIREALTALEALDDDIRGSLNYPEMAKRAFREVARVAGLVYQGPPSARKSVRHLQMSSSLLFDVFSRYEPDHPLLAQAYREVQEQQLQLERLRDVMRRIAAHEFLVVPIPKLTPFAFPLFIERIQSRLSTEKFEQRIERLQREAFS